MAEILELDSTTYGKYEFGQHEPRHETVKKLADYFNVTVDYLLGRSDIRNPGEVSAASSDLDYDELPLAAISELMQYKEFLIQKYGKK